MSLPDSTSLLPAQQHWQCRLGHTGEIATQADDLIQALHVIAMTPLGSDPLRPLFGCNAQDYLDWPLLRAIPHLVRELTHAWKTWEPRVRIESIDFRSTGVGHVTVHTKIEVLASRLTLTAILPLRAGLL